MEQHQVIIAGMGLSGLAAAARLSELGVKDIAVYGNGYGGTPFIAAVNFVLDDNPSGDTTGLYYEDMIRIGYEEGDRALVREMTARSPDGYELLRRWGVEFAHEKDGSLKRRLLSGHSKPRTLCCTDRLIGIEMLEKLTQNLEKAGVQLYHHCDCLKLLTEGGHVTGITIRDENGTVRNVYASAVIAAWGGVGRMFGTSTYPDDIKGNTLAIAHDAGARLIDLEFIEYEPMVVASPPGAVGEPCPTAMLGEGAHLVNSDGERFLLKVRPEGEPGAPKSLINHEIWKQVDAGKGSPHGGIWVDMRHIDREVLRGYPWFFDRLMENGVDPNRDLVEVAPMAHSTSGGVKVGTDYQSTLPGFYAVGEACGGVHGACRSGGNAAAQATMSALLCAEAVAKIDLNRSVCEQPAVYNVNKEIFDRYIPEARALCAEAMGIFRRGETLEKTLARLNEMLDDPELDKDTEAKQILTSMQLLVTCALRRKESRGTHNRLDYPEQDPALAHGFDI